MPKMKLDVVCEGGGVKGIAFIGALERLELEGYEINSSAGTSAGAIVTALVAAGYKAGQLKEIMNTLDYKKFKDEDIIDLIPYFGKILSLTIEKGVFEGDYFETWLTDLLYNAPDGPIVYFGDLKRPFKCIAADISRGKMLTFPDDAADYGIDSMNGLKVAHAVRMSMSIPFFFEPIIMKDKSDHDCYIVDGGVLSNYPVHLFDSPNIPRWPTFGLNLMEPKTQPYPIYGPISMFAAMFQTMLSARDIAEIETNNFVRTIYIPTFGIKAMDFDLTNEQRDVLFKSGMIAANNFLKDWDFETYIKNFRTPIQDILNP